MIGQQPTGAVPGVTISTVAGEGLTVSIDGKPGRLAIVDDEGHVIAAGAQVAQEVRAVAVNSYRAFLEGRGHLRTRSRPIDKGQP
jgi:hypothetical protein